MRGRERRQNKKQKLNTDKKYKPLRIENQEERIFIKWKQKVKDVQKNVTKNKVRGREKKFKTIKEVNEYESKNVKYNFSYTVNTDPSVECLAPARKWITDI